MRISISATVAATLLFHVLGLAVSAADTPGMAKAPFNAKQANAFQQQWAKHIGKELVHTNSVGMKLKLIPPGEYTCDLLITRENGDVIAHARAPLHVSPATP